MDNKLQKKIKYVKTFSLVHIIVNAFVCLYISVMALSAFLGGKNAGRTVMGLTGMGLLIITYILFLVFYFVQKNKVAKGQFMKIGKFLGMSIPYLFFVLFGYAYYKIALSSTSSPIFSSVSSFIPLVIDIIALLSYFPLVILFINYIYIAKHSIKATSQKVIVNKYGQQVIIKEKVKEKAKVYNVLVYIAIPLAIISLIAFALPYITEKGWESINMFQWMFGFKEDLGGGLSIIWKNQKLVFNLVWEAVIIALCVLLFSFKKNKSKLVITAPLTGVIAIFSMVAAITCLSSNKTAELAGSSLSVGPIVYSVIQFIVMTLMLVGVAIELYKNEGVRNFFKRNNAPTTNSNAKGEKKVEPKKKKFVIKEENFASSESDTIKALKEYKELLDAGVITKAEFDKKKKELLDK